MRRIFSASLLTVSLSVLALSACSGGDRTAGTPAPMPPISEMDAAMSAPAPESYDGGSATLTPVAPVSSGGSTEDRIAALEQSVATLRSDFDKMAPAFASLNTTNERIQSILTRMESNGARGSTVTTTTIEAEPLAPAAAAPVPVARPIQSSSAPRDILPPSTTVTSGNGQKIITSSDAPPIPTASGQMSVTKTVSQSKIESPRPVVSPVSRQQPALEPPVLSTTATTTTTTAKAQSPAAPISATSPYPPADVAASKTAVPVPASAAAGGVRGLRIGEHSGKTRLVFDLTSSQKPAFKVDIDNGEKIMLVDMPSSSWNGAANGSPNSPLIASWNAQSGAGGGSAIAIQLKKPAKVLSTEFLKAEGKDPARMVVDIAAQ